MEKTAYEERRAKFGDGPWLDEPDRVEWRYQGVPCLMVRHPSLGHWCGYAGMPPGHPWHGVGYDAVHELTPTLDVHGALTYAGPCSEDVCHVPEPGESDHVWWLGFDCAHSGDYCPSRGASLGRPMNPVYEKYRDQAWVVAEVERLAAASLRVAQRDETPTENGNDSTPPKAPPSQRVMTPMERLRRDSEVMQKIADALEPLADDATRLRVVKAVAALLDVELEVPKARKARGRRG